MRASERPALGERQDLRVHNEKASRILIPVDCAVNDDYGNTSDRISAIHFPGLELDAVDMRGPTFRVLPPAVRQEPRIRIGRREYAARHLASCVGNLYWERFGMPPTTAAWCLHTLREAGAFTFDAGYGELVDWWESRIRDEAWVAECLIEAAKEDRL
jgi:hypothetical protein